MASDQKKVDLSPLVEAAVPEAKALAEGGDLPAALERLLSTEKKTRLGGEAKLTATLAVAIVTLCWEARDFKSLNAHVLILAKRRAQLNRPIIDMVQKSMTFLDEIADQGTREELIETLRTVTAGKIFVEVERARLTRMISKMREDEGKTKEASEILQEVQVETYGSMEKREKAEFILEQMRLTLAQRDFVRTQIISRKISKKVLDSEGFEEEKVRYYRMLVQLHSHNKEPMLLARDYEAIYNTKTIKEDVSARGDALRHVALYLALSPFDNEQSDFMHKLLLDKHMDEVPTYQALLKHLTTDLIASWPLPEAGELDAHLAAIEGDWQDTLHKRVVQHNLRVIAKCYTRVRLGRMADLLSLSGGDSEKFLSEMVTEKLVYARIDRPAGIVSFQRPHDSTAHLSAWAEDIGECLSLVERTTHLINRENMVHKLRK